MCGWRGWRGGRRKRQRTSTQATQVQEAQAAREGRRQKEVAQGGGERAVVLPISSQSSRGESLLDFLDGMRVTRTSPTVLETAMAKSATASAD